MADTAQFCVGFFSVSSGVTTTQTVTGVTDRQGNAFRPKALVFFGTTGGFIDSGQLVHQNFGFDDGVDAEASCVQSNRADSTIWASFGAGPTASLLRTHARLNATLDFTALVTATAVGSFSYTPSTNHFGFSSAYLAIGGSAVSAVVGSVDPVGTPTTVTVGFEPTCVLLFEQDLTGIGVLSGFRPSFGWADTELRQGSSAAILGDGNGLKAYRYQRTDTALVVVGGNGAGEQAHTITSYTDTGFVLTGAGRRVAYLALKGLSAKAGSFTQGGDGSVVVPVTDFTPRAVLLASTNHATATTVQSDMAFSFGAADGITQQSGWQAALQSGNDSGNAGQCWGGNLALRMATPNGAASSAATLQGDLTVDGFAGNAILGTWANSDSSPREVIFLALGPVSTTPVTVTYPMRRMRRFELPYADNKWVFLRRLEFIYQPGEGTLTGQGQHPIAMIRISRDGGRTWGPEIQLEAGDQGDYTKRMYAYQLGRYRQGVCELVVTDPNAWYFLDCVCTWDVGTS